jgi:hypothetical protein
MTTLLVCGGRHYGDSEIVDRVLSKIVKDADVSLIVHGGATGADALAEVWARRHGVPTAPEPVSKAEWRARGKAAGPIRNRRMLHKYAPDLVVAFPGHDGTADMMKPSQEGQRDGRDRITGGRSSTMSNSESLTMMPHRAERR